MTMGWSDIDRTLALVDEYRRRFDSLFDELDLGARVGPVGAWPHTNLCDTGQNLVLYAEVPGLTEKDVEIAVHENAITLSGERKLDVPDGYEVLRQERMPVQFARSFTLPFKVDASGARAEIKDGVLCVTIPKAPEAQPKRISVKTH